MISALFCVTRWGWGYDRYLEEANTGRGLKLSRSRWMKYYLQFILPALILLVLLGWMGGHRYYEHRWVLGAIYTAFCWTGIPFAMCVIDAMIVIPKKADENGMITM